MEQGRRLRRFGCRCAVFLHIHGLGTYVKHGLPSVVADLPFAPHDQDTEIRQQTMRWNVDLCECFNVYWLQVDWG